MVRKSAYGFIWPLEPVETSIFQTKYPLLTHPLLVLYIQNEIFLAHDALKDKRQDYHKSFRMCNKIMIS